MIFKRKLRVKEKTQKLKMSKKLSASLRTFDPIGELRNSKCDQIICYILGHLKRLKVRPIAEMFKSLANIKKP